MKILEKHFRGDKEIELVELVTYELTNSLYDGSIEQTHDKIEKQAKFIAAIVNVLVDKGLLTESEFVKALYGYEKDEISFVK